MRRILEVLTVSVLILAMTATTAFGAAETTVSRYTGTTYSHSAVNSDKLIVRGIDVSAWQDNVDWNKVKADGVDYAIIRIGYRGTTSGKMNPDKDFIEHIEGAKAAGLMVGVYFFSQAINELEAVAEAQYTLKLLGDYELDLPVFMDYEFSGGSSGRLTKANLSKSAATKVARAFCEEVKALGGKPGIYANLNFLNNTINGERLGQEYPIWVAQYYKQCNYEHDYDWWQYSSGGSVAGISGRVDCNYWYLDEAAAATSENSIVNATVTLLDSASYTFAPGKAHTPRVSVTHNWLPLTEGVDYTVKYVNNTEAGTAYAMVMGRGAYTDYRLIPFTINPTSDTSGITVEKVADATYTGKEQKPSSVVLKDALGRTLVNNLDYIYTVSNAVDAGTAKINVTLLGNYTGSRSATYEIKKADQEIKLAWKTGEVPIDQADFNLGATLKFSGAKLTYSSSDEKVVSVASDGTVSVNRQGSATITVKAGSTKNVKAAEKTFNITVTKPVQTVTAKYTKYSKDMNDTTFNLVGVKSDGNGKITYTSSDENVATVSSKGKVTVVGPGTAIITATAAETDDYAAGSLQMTVTVKKMDQTVTTGYTKYKRKDLDGKFNINAKTGGDGELTFVSSDETVATIDSKGRVTVVGPGVAEFTVTAAETEKYLPGRKVVTLTVSGFDTPEEREARKAEIIVGVEGTGIKSVKLTATGKKVRADWVKEGSGYAFDYYQVWRSTKKNSGYKKIFTTTDARKCYYVNSKDVKKSTTYWYKVRGVREIDGELVYGEFKKVSVKTKSS